MGRCAASRAGRWPSSATSTGRPATFFQKRAPKSKPDWIETVELRVPVGPDRRRGGRRATPAQLAWIVNLGCIDLNPHPVRAEDLDHPDELRVDLDPVPGVPGRRSATWRWSPARSLGRGRPRRLAEDLGLARHPRQRPHRAAVDVHRGPPRRAGAGARGRAARARHRHREVVEGGAPRRVPRLQPEREGPDRGLGLLGAARRRTRACRCRCAGTRSPTCEPGDFTLRTVPERFAERGDPGAGIDDGAGLARGAARAVGRATRPRAGRRAVAAALPEAGGRAAAGRAVTAGRAATRSRSRSIADRHRPSDEGATRSPGWSAGRRATRRRRRTSSRPTSWWTRCGAGSRPGPGSG